MKLIPARTYLSTVLLLAIVAVGNVGEAQAKVSAFFSSGTDCTGAPSATFVPKGPKLKVSLCVTATTEALCGHTTKLQTASPSASGSFHITAVSLGTNYPDPNTELKFPIAVTNPASSVDFGGTAANAAISKTTRQQLVSFELAPQASATEEAYVIGLADASSIGISSDGTCAMASDMPIAANFKLINNLRKAPKK